MAKKAKKSSKKKKALTGIPHRIEDFFPQSWNRPLWWGIPAIPDLMAPANVRIPRVDMRDLGNEILVEAELPGVQRKDLKIQAADNAVTISAEDEYEASAEVGEYYYREMGRGELRRTLLLPCGVDLDHAEAKLRDGILKLRLPKLEVAIQATAQQTIPVE